MIVKGDFEVVSMAIYGEVVTEHTVPETYEPRLIPSFDSSPIPPALDPANSHDPTQLARQLLTLVPEAPQLPLVVRLIFALKPSGYDWDLPDFPHLHPDLDEDIAEFDLEKASALLIRPVPDDISAEPLERFAGRVAQCIKAKVDIYSVSLTMPQADGTTAGQGQQPSLPCSQHIVSISITASALGNVSAGNAGLSSNHRSSLFV